MLSKYGALVDGGSGAVRLVRAVKERKAMTNMNHERVIWRRGPCRGMDDRWLFIASLVVIGSCGFG